MSPSRAIQTSTTTAAAVFETSRFPASSIPARARQRSSHAQDGDEVGDEVDGREGVADDQGPEQFRVPGAVPVADGQVEGVGLALERVRPFLQGSKSAPHAGTAGAKRRTRGSLPRARPPPSRAAALPRMAGPSSSSPGGSCILPERPSRFRMAA